MVTYNEILTIAVQETLGDKAVVVQSERTPESMLEHGRDADIVVAGRVSGDFIREAPNLKMIQALGAGIDKIDRQAVLDRGDIIVCNNHRNASEVAEYAIMLLFAAAKNIILSDRELRKGDWVFGFGGPNPNVEVRNKTCLIMGLGNIGAEIAKRLNSFDLTLKAVTRSGKSPNAALVDSITSIDKMKPYVQDADFIILSLPLTHESRGLIDSEIISWMNPSAILVNISRGEIVEEAALFQALKEKRIMAAGLDVWWNYPHFAKPGIEMPSLRFPFHELDNIVMSPHRAAYSLGTQLAHLEFIRENVLRFVSGERPLHIVDMNLGY